MSEFGHTGIIVEGGLCMDSWGAGPFVITVEGRAYRFEDSDRFGPSIIKLNGDIAARQPNEQAPFWDAHRHWVAQGRRIEADKVTCIWDAPSKPSVVRVVGKRSVYMVKSGDGGYVTEDGQPWPPPRKRGGG